MVIQDNNKIFFEDFEIQTIGKIPLGTWAIRVDKDRGFFLSRIEDFTVPSKIYGNYEQLSDRYINTFKKHDKNLGIALTGLKGTGKSLMAKMICTKANLPVIVIDAPFSGPGFNSMIERIKQECIVFVDEFEKVYDKNDDQKGFLTLLDGIFMGKKMFIFTSNDTSKYSNYLINRPGRIHYLKKYETVEENVVRDIATDNLKDKTKVESLVNYIVGLEEANIDMVFALVREINDYGETVVEAVKHLNIAFTTNEGDWNVKFEEDDTGYIYSGYCSYNPLASGSFWLDLNLEKADNPEFFKNHGNSEPRKKSTDSDDVFAQMVDEYHEKDNLIYKNIQVTPEQIAKAIPLKNKVTIICHDGRKLVFTKKERFSYTYGY